MKKLLFLILLFLLVPFIYADAKWYDGTYFGITFPYYSSKGDRFGSGYFYYDKDGERRNLILPELEPAFGYGIIIGGEASKRHLFKLPVISAVEFGYILFNHNAKWRGETFSVKHKSFNINCKWYFRPDQKIQPYLGISPYLSWLDVRGGAFDSNWNTIGNATLYGAGFNFECAIRYNLSRKLKILSSLMFNFEGYDRASYNGERGYVTNAPYLLGINYSLRIDYML